PSGLREPERKHRCPRRYDAIGAAKKGQPMEDIDDEILTGEGVALSTGAASVTLRMLSGIVDLVAYGVVGLLALAAVERAVSPLNAAAGRAAMIFTAVVMLVLAPACVETLTRGRSPGRFAAGLRVVHDD